MEFYEKHSASSITVSLLYIIDSMVVKLKLLEEQKKVLLQNSHSDSYIA